MTKPVNSKANRTRLVLIFLAVLVLGVLASRQLLKNPSISREDWNGLWNITYFYESDPTLVYQGVLELNLRDSLNGRLEVVAPLSRRAETLTLSGLSFVEAPTRLSGEMVHNLYKIKGGHLQETFEWQLENPGHFRGSGRCTAFCAEGTEGVTIIWQANKFD